MLKIGRWFFEILMLICLPLCFASAAEPDMSIGLVENQFAAELQADGDFYAANDNGKILLSKGKYFVNAGNGRINIGSHYFTSDVVLIPKDSHKYFSLNKQAYRGKIQVLLSENKKLYVNNLVPMEDYVASVLGPKSSAIWPDEAIKAQAVAVRSFAYYKLQHATGNYALKATDADMFYGGVKNEVDLVSKIARTTAGEVLFYEGSPAITYTSESSGGRTANAASLLHQNIPYLISVEDYDKDSPEYSWTKVIAVTDLTRILMQNGYNVGKLKSYKLSPLKKPFGDDRTTTGRVLNMYFKGDSGDASLTGREVANLFSLNSTLFDAFVTTVVPDKIDVPIENPYGMEIGRKEIPISVSGPDGTKWNQVLPGYVMLNGNADEKIVFKGHGLGSGLGLTKWGAKGMADAAPQGVKDYYKVILAHYYPGTYITNI
jgi:stage II sporulation protein D